MKITEFLKYACVPGVFALTSCTQSINAEDGRYSIIKKIISIPIKESNSSFEIFWMNDSSYAVFDPNAFRFYKITGNKIDTVPQSGIKPVTKNSYENIVQTDYGVPALINVYDGIFTISDTINAYLRPIGGIRGIHGASITKSGMIYAWGSGGVWVGGIGSNKVLDPTSELFEYDTRGLYADDSVGIITRSNQLLLFKGKAIIKKALFPEVGIEQHVTSGYITDWIGKMNGFYYIFQDGTIGIKYNPKDGSFKQVKAASNQIVSFTDGDCFFSKRMDMTIWCNDGEKIATLTSGNSDLGDEMIYAGRNSSGHWISDGYKLILLDLEKAKAIARK